MKARLSLIIVGCCFAIASQGMAAVVGVDSITTSPASTNTLDRDTYALLTVTAGGATYDSLAAASSATVSSSGSTDVYFWANNGTNDPGSANNVLLNQLISAGLLNSSPTVQFSTTLDQFEQFFIFELDGNDSITVQAVDSNGDAIDLSLSISSSAWGAGLRTGVSVNYANNPLAGFQRNDKSIGGEMLTTNTISGLAFAGSDLTGTGNLADATGFVITGSGIDPVLVTGALVPEPTSLLLLGVGGLLVARRRRVSQQ